MICTPGHLNWSKIQVEPRLKEKKSQDLKNALQAWLFNKFFICVSRKFLELPGKDL